MSKKWTKKDSSSRMNPYHIDKFASVSPRFKIGFLLFWLAGATFMLAILGLPPIFDIFDRLVVLVLLLTLGIEYIANALITWMHTSEFDALAYLPHEFSRKSIWSLFASLIYVSIIVVSFHFLLEFYVSLGFKTIGDVISQSTADPFSFAIWFLLLHSIWLRIRKLFKKPIGRK